MLSLHSTELIIGCRRNLHNTINVRFLRDFQVLFLDLSTIIMRLESHLNFEACRKLKFHLLNFYNKQDEKKLLIDKTDICVTCILRRTCKCCYVCVLAWLFLFWVRFLQIQIVCALATRTFNTYSSMSHQRDRGASWTIFCFL